MFLTKKKDAASEEMSILWSPSKIPSIISFQKQIPWTTLIMRNPIHFINTMVMWNCMNNVAIARLARENAIRSQSSHHSASAKASLECIHDELCIIRCGKNSMLRTQQQAVPSLRLHEHNTLRGEHAADLVDIQVPLNCTVSRAAHR